MNRELKHCSVYKHYKGGLYYVMGEAQSTDDLSELVVYHALDEDTETWVRRKEEFLSEVDEYVDNPTGQKYRFELLEEDNNYETN